MRVDYVLLRERGRQTGYEQPAFEVATGEGFYVAAGVIGRAGQGEWKRSD